MPSQRHRHRDVLDEPVPFEPPRMSWAARLMVVAAAAGGCWYFNSLGDYFGIGVVIAIVLGGFSGFKMGFTRIAATLAAMAAAFYFAPQFGISQEAKFTEWFGSTGLLNRFISIVSVGAGIALAVTVVLLFVSRSVLRNSPGLARTNAWFGFLTGCAQSGIAVLLFVGGLLIVEPMELQRANDPQLQRSERSQQMSDIILTVTEYAHESQLGPYVEEYNPFKRIPQLNKLQQVQRSVQVLSDPQKINQLMRHPSITQLQERPEVKDVVNQIMTDPEISQLLNAGGKMDSDAAIKLLSHPAIMQLIDQPGFLEEASRIIDASPLADTIDI